MTVASLLLLLVVGIGPIQTQNEVHDYRLTGTASNYPCTKGWCDGTPTVALPLALGGRYTGEVRGVVTVCADRCADIIVVDYCQCYWGTEDERIVDLNHAAWDLVSDAPLEEGLITVTLTSRDEAVAPDTRMYSHGLQS